MRVRITTEQEPNSVLELALPRLSSPEQLEACLMVARANYLAEPPLELTEYVGGIVGVVCHVWASIGEQLGHRWRPQISRLVGENADPDNRHWGYRAIWTRDHNWQTLRDGNYHQIAVEDYLASDYFLLGMLGTMDSSPAGRMVDGWDQPTRMEMGKAMVNHRENEGEYVPQSRENAE